MYLAFYRYLDSKKMEQQALLP